MSGLRGRGPRRPGPSVRPAPPTGGGSVSRASNQPRTPTQAEVCEHYWSWVSPAGTSRSARICMLCHDPDPEWLNHTIEVDLGHPRPCVHCEFPSASDWLAQREATLRSSIAAEIEAEIEPERPDDLPAERGRRIGMEDAARIARRGTK